MRTKVLAALIGAMAMGCAGEAGATVMAGTAEGVFTSAVSHGESYWPGPSIAVGDTISIDFRYDTGECGFVAGSSTCFGGAGAPTWAGNPGSATFSVDGWTQTVGGTEYQFVNPGTIHLEDAWLNLWFSVTPPPGATLDAPFSADSGAGLLAWDEGTWPHANFSLRSFQVAPVPEPSTWVMMLAGLFGLGAVLRSRRSPRFAEVG